MESQKNVQRDKKVLELFIEKLFKPENESLCEYINKNREFSDLIFGEKTSVESVKDGISKIPEPKVKKKSKKQAEKAKEERKKLKDSFLQLIYLAENEYEKSQQEKTQNSKEILFKSENLDDRKIELTELEKDSKFLELFVEELLNIDPDKYTRKIGNLVDYIWENKGEKVKTVQLFASKLGLSESEKKLINRCHKTAKEKCKGKNGKEEKEIPSKNKNKHNTTNINSINIINEEPNTSQKKYVPNSLPYSFTYKDNDDCYEGAFKQGEKTITNEIGCMGLTFLPVPKIYKERTDRLVDFLFDMSNRLDSCIEYIMTELFTELSSSIGPNKRINKNNKFDLSSYNSLRQNAEEYNKLISFKEYKNAWQFYGAQIYYIENILYDSYVGYIEKGENFFLTDNKSGDTDIPGYRDFFRDYIKEMEKIHDYKIPEHKGEHLKKIYAKTKKFIIETMKHEIEIERKIIEQAMTIMFFYPNKKESSNLISISPSEIESLLSDYIKEVKEDIKEQIKEETKLNKKELDKLDTGEVINFLEKNYSGKFNMDKLMKAITKRYSDKPIERGLIHYSDNVWRLINILQFLSKKEPGERLFDDNMNKLVDFLEKNKADKLDTGKLKELLKQYPEPMDDHSEEKPSDVRMAHGLISLLKENYLDRLGMDKLRNALQPPEESELNKLAESKEQLTWVLIKNDLNKIFKKDNQFFDEFVNCEIESKGTSQITSLRCFIFMSIAHKYPNSQAKNFENMDKVYSELCNNHCGWYIDIYRALVGEILNCLNRYNRYKKQPEKSSHNSNLYNQNNLSNGIKKQADLTKHGFQSLE